MNLYFVENSFDESDHINQYKISFNNFGMLGSNGLWIVPVSSSTILFWPYLLKGTRGKNNKLNWWQHGHAQQ